MDKRLFIIANRLPISIIKEDSIITTKAASGGLVSAIKSYLNTATKEYSEVFWAGIAECTDNEWTEISNCFVNDDFTYLPVMVNKSHYNNYYNGFSNSILWPLFHYFPSYVEYNSEDYKDYLNINQRFVEAIKINCRKGDTIWIHDYHLLPLAGMLRKEIPEVEIGFFLHIPFPSYEIFRLLPKEWQKELLDGMLGADLIGFHTMDYTNHFLQCTQLILGVNNDRNILRYKDRLIKADVFPISINFELFNNAYDDPEVIIKRDYLRSRLTVEKIIFSVDRLDYTKGVHNRLKAFECFLQKNPEFHNKVIFIIVVVPSRDNIPKYIERKKMIDELISHINSHLGNLHWQPIMYQYNTLSFVEMVALYTLCDLALITPLRDGMNLVAKEFVASRKDKKGVLVLSEMAGAASELNNALIINPNDTNEIADKIKEGLLMDVEEQETRMVQMQKRISNYNVNTWVDDFMKELNNIREKQLTFQEIFLDEFSKINLFNCYRESKKRLLLLDYDGTLVPFTSTPDLAVPGDALLKLIENLGSVPANDLYLISGRSSQWLDKHFNNLPVNLIAEHGAKVKDIGGTWNIEVSTHSEWKEQVYNIMEMYVRRCPHSLIEEKEFSIVWHFRNADVDQGKLRATELFNELKNNIPCHHLEVISGNKIIEVRNSGINKGTAINKILKKDTYDFIFAAGDDKTDEDMFKELVGRENCFTIKVGPNASYAQYNLLKPEMIISLLANLNHLQCKIPIL